MIRNHPRTSALQRLFPFWFDYDEDPQDDPAPPPQTPPAGSDAELAALKAQLADTAAQVLAGVPENLRDLIPAGLSPADQIAWFHKAKATGVFDKPAVPPTDGGERPAITPKEADPSTLPAFARIAAGYRK